MITNSSELLLPEFIKKEYPFKHNFLTLENCGCSEKLKLHFLDEGKGRPVVMVHGNPTWSFFYRNLVKDLKGEFRCIVPDHIGCGLSSKPQKYPYTLKGHIDNLAQLIESLGLESFDMVVHDWGGAIGVGVAERFSEKLGKLVIMNTSVFKIGEIPWQLKLCRMGGFSEFLLRKLNLFVRTANLRASTKGLKADIQKAYSYPYNNWENRVAVYQFVQDIPENEGHRSYGELKQIEEGLEKLRGKEVQILWGGRDFIFTSKYFDKWKKIFPGAKTKFYENAGHYLLEDEKNDVNVIIKEFLN